MMDSELLQALHKHFGSLVVDINQANGLLEPLAFFRVSAHRFQIWAYDGHGNPLPDQRVEKLLSDIEFNTLLGQFSSNNPGLLNQQTPFLTNHPYNQGWSWKHADYAHGILCSHTQESLAGNKALISALNLWEALSDSVTHLHQVEVDQEVLMHKLGRDVEPDLVIGAEGGLRPVLTRARLTASTNIPILLLGETGSGKEVVARYIHRQSTRAEEPFIRVNCGAIPSELLDSELFGHEKGSFTGATNRREGWFERADGGTLFLDEVGELALPAQVRLLHLLQDGTFYRVGGERPITTDVRIIAATHRDLPTLVSQGKFREDLWYRLAVFPIILPPLRAHSEDIPALALHFMKRASRRFGLALPPLREQDVALMRRYSWPGNVRELAAVIDRALLLGQGQQLAVADALGNDGMRSEPDRHRSVTLDDQYDNGSSRRPLKDNSSPSHNGTTGSGVDSLNDAIKEHISRALAACNGKISGADGAAQLLNMNASTLRAKMYKLGLL